MHVLTLTATPIPRTLQLALSGVREMSLIASPPIDRLAVRTFVMPYDPVTLREASIMRERDLRRPGVLRRAADRRPRRMGSKELRQQLLLARSNSSVEVQQVLGAGVLVKVRKR